MHKQKQTLQYFVAEICLVAKGGKRWQKQALAAHVGQVRVTASIVSEQHMKRIWLNL